MTIANLKKFVNKLSIMIHPSMEGTVMMPLTADDVVSGIFYHIKKHKKEILSADRENLHTTFYNIKKKYPDVMLLFTFRLREHFPESSQLDQALSNLDASGIITRQNMTPRYYHLEGALDKSYEKFSKALLKKAGINESRIEEVALEIEKMVVATR